MINEPLANNQFLIDFVGFLVASNGHIAPISKTTDPTIPAITESSIVYKQTSKKLFCLLVRYGFEGKLQDKEKIPQTFVEGCSLKIFFYFFLIIFLIIVFLVGVFFSVAFFAEVFFAGAVYFLAQAFGFG